MTAATTHLLGVKTYTETATILTATAIVRAEYTMAHTATVTARMIAATRATRATP